MGTVSGRLTSHRSLGDDLPRPAGGVATCACRGRLAKLRPLAYTNYNSKVYHFYVFHTNTSSK